MGRIATSAITYAAQPPTFKLNPDVVGYEGEGGIVGWVDLLKIREKEERMASGAAAVKDGCVGAVESGECTAGDVEACGEGEEGWWSGSWCEGLLLNICMIDSFCMMYDSDGVGWDLGLLKASARAFVVDFLSLSGS